MTEPAAGAPAPIVPAPVAPPAAAGQVNGAAPPAAPLASDPNGAHPWLPDRLTRAEEAGQARALAALGITDIEKGKAILAAAKAAEDANKSAEQRAAEATTQAATQRAEADRLRAITAEHATRMMAVLTPEQQAAVKAIAKDDAALQLATIGALSPTWTVPAAVVAPAAPPPGNTAPPPNAPPPAGAGSPPDPVAVYQQQLAVNPFVAAAHGLANQREVFKTPT